VTLDALKIEGAKELRHVALYDDLRQILVRAKYPFRILPSSHEGRWDRALFLNLTYWGASEGGDVLVDKSIAADVVAHVAWHHLAAQQVGSSSVEAMLLGESIASAFDLYLVGRLLGRDGRSSFLETQVPAMAEAAQGAGATARAFETLLSGIAAAPERAFGELRALLFDVARELYDCKSAGEAHAVLAKRDRHRFGALLHHYELSNWVLFARAHAKKAGSARARKVDRALSAAKDPIAWLSANWIEPSLR
jgi:hypothetical protein